MDKLALSTTTNPDGTFSTRWQWWQNFDLDIPGGGSRRPVSGGTVTVSLAERWIEDRPILAEICAIFQLMCVDEVHGKNRLGSNIQISVSFAAIRKALSKAALKTTDRGDTEKYNVALFTKFLATKYFAADVISAGASKWQPFEFECPQNTHIFAPHLPSVDIPSPVGAISVTHHAINRIVERRMTEGLAEYVRGDLTTIPNVRWSRAWRWLERVLPVTTVADVPRHVMAKIVAKYGTEIKALRCIGSQSVFVLKEARHGWDLVTVLDDNFTNRLTSAHKLPVQCGQELVFPGGFAENRLRNSM